MLPGVEPEFGAPPPPGGMADDARPASACCRSYAFYIGGFDERKNVPLLMRAWARGLAPPIEAAHAGEPLPVLAHGRAAARAGRPLPRRAGLAASLGLLAGDAARDWAVALPGPGERGRISGCLLAGARLFAFPSRYEGFGYDPLEAMAAGARSSAPPPARCPRSPATRGCWCRPVRSIPGRARSTCVWHDAGLRAGLVARGRARAARFDPAVTAARTLQAYLDRARG